MRRALALPLPLPLLLALALAAPPVAARDSLGIFERWGAFRDLGVPRCYAIAKDARMDAALIAALRGGGEMTVSARAANGRTFRDTFVLRGAASAIDAAALGCSGV